MEICQLIVANVEIHAKYMLMLCYTVFSLFCITDLYDDLFSLRLKQKRLQIIFTIARFTDFLVVKEGKLVIVNEFGIAVGGWLISLEITKNYTTSIMTTKVFCVNIRYSKKKSGSGRMDLRKENRCSQLLFQAI